MKLVSVVGTCKCFYARKLLHTKTNKTNSCKVSSKNWKTCFHCTQKLIIYESGWEGVQKCQTAKFPRGRKGVGQRTVRRKTFVCRETVRLSGNFLQVAVCRGNFRSCDCPFTDILHIDKHLKKENDQIPFYDGCCRPDLDIPKILKYLFIIY